MTVRTITVGSGRADTAPRALVTCCALAIAYRQGLTVVDREHAERLVDQVLSTRTEQQTLAWRQHSFASDWDTYWRRARGALRRFYPELPGAFDIPDDHAVAGLPEIFAAPVKASVAAPVARSSPSPSRGE